MSVYKAIAAIMEELSKQGIAKDRTNSQGSGYKFRGVDDVLNALSPLLPKHNLCILPRVLSRSVTEHKSKAGSALFYVVVESEFDLVSSDDGSKHTVKTFGEAMDSGDKATNKAMSMAYKYACIQAFCIPTESSVDADSQTYEVAGVEFDLILALNAVEEASNLAQLELVWLSRSKLARDANDRPSYDALAAAVKDRKEALSPKAAE